MNIIIPMAGMGKRMRPHTLTTPKPLLPIAGKPIVHRLVEDIAKVAGHDIKKVAFIIGDFGPAVEESLKEIARSVGAEGSIHYQHEALGTAHAIMCAKEVLEGPVIVAFADTLFKADFKLDTSKDGTIWVQRVEDPRAYGVVKMNERNEITDFVEKPEHFVSDLAIIGIYYFKDGAYLRSELQYLLDNDIREKGEYQLTNALENMKNKGTVFVPGQISEWLDCGNKDATVFSNQRYLEYLKGEKLQHESAKITNSVLIEPVYLGEGVEVDNSVLGPHVSIGDGTKVDGSIISNSIIAGNSTLKNAHLVNSMVGAFVALEGRAQDMSIGDYSTVRE
jgi:glucose-1-phosphate thymidylyltransferase